METTKHFIAGELEHLRKQTLSPRIFEHYRTQQHARNDLHQSQLICGADSPKDEILSIEFMNPGVPSRKIISRSNTKPTGRYPSIRLQRMVLWDSPHELNAYRLLDSDPAILEFAEQPCIIHYRLNGKCHRHYPDTLVKTAAGDALWEIKTASDASRPDVAERTHLMTTHLPAFGFQYQVVLAEDLSRQPRLRNVQFLLRHGREELSFEEQEYARQLFTTVDRMKWQAVLCQNYKPFTLKHMCRLILEGQLLVDINQAFSPSTIISVKGRRHG